MFKKLFHELAVSNACLNSAKVELSKEIKAANALVKESKQLLSKIEMAQKRGGVLLLNDLDAGLIEKLQSLTPDDNVVLIFTPDGSRIEIKHRDANYIRDLGQIR